MIKLHDSLLKRKKEIKISYKMIKRDGYLAVNGQELTRHVLILVTEDDLDLVSPGGHHWGEVISANVDSSEEEIVK